MELAERIATKVESIYTGLVAVHDLLVEELVKALEKDYSEVSALEAIDKVYPIGNMPTLQLVKIVATEMEIERPKGEAYE